MKTIIVTGASRGIGKEIIKKLLVEAPEFGTICMTSTRVEDVQRVAEELRKEIDSPARLVTHQLDLLDPASIQAFAQVVQNELAPVDVLLNNAGLAFKGDRLDDEVFVKTFGVNYYGTIQLTDLLLNSMAPSGHIIIVSSYAGKLASVPSQALKDRIMNPDITRQELDALTEDFHATVNQGNFEQKGWRRAGYATSKVMINGYTRILNRELRASGSQVRVNAVHPGWVRTDMAGPNAPDPPELGAITPVFLAKDTSDATGLFWDSKCSPWDW